MNTSLQTAQISSIVQELNKACTIISDADLQKEAARLRAISAAKDLVAKLENPAEIILQHAFSGPDRVCVRLAIQLGIFHTLTKRNGLPIDATDLAATCGAEVLFIVRIMRILTASKYVGEAGVESYVATPLTRTMTVPPIEAAVRFTFDHAFQCFPQMPAYFEKNGYHCPTDPLAAPLQYTFNTDLHIWDYIEKKSKTSRDFDTFMTASRKNRPIFADWFPVQEQILDGYRCAANDEDGVLLVDIGGGRGQDVETFKNRFPGARGRMILQDLPRTVEHAKLSPGIEVMAHDFMKPQPIKGARTYFFHYILHNWPDPLARTILRNTAAAMEPSYSKIILNEYILPAQDCPQSASWADMHMMGGLAALERSEKQWRELVRGTGLTVVRFWFPDGSIDGVIELMLEEDGHGGANGIVDGSPVGTTNGVDGDWVEKNGIHKVQGDTNGHS